MGVRCLIVDDNQAFLVAARALLERDGLPVAAVAATGAEAVLQMRAFRPDVVLLDVMLGEESGFEVARRLADCDDDDADGATVILISTLPKDELVDLVAASAAAGFLPKSELSAQAVREVVSAHRRR
jgi:two-component system nitrate/nitrite response regulator NarL